MCNDFGRSFQHDTKTRNDKRYPTGVGLPVFLSNNMVIIFQPTLFAFFLACLHTDHIYTILLEYVTTDESLLFDSIKEL